MNYKRIFETLRSYDFKSIDFRLIIYVILLTILGINVISSASDDPSLVQKQIIGMGMGIVLMIIFALIRYDFLARYYWLMYLVSLIALVLVLTPLGRSGGGAQRWIVVLGIYVQPSELAKLLMLFFFSALLAKNWQNLNSWKFLFLVLILIVIPIALILREPDLSTSIVTFLMICAIILSSTIQSKYLKRAVLVAIPVVAAVLALIIILPAEKNIISQYQYNRLIGFYDPDNEVADTIRYQQENSVIAIAGGSLTGKGLKNNSITSVKNADFISAPETDFIFTIIGEELGFLGSVATILLLVLIVIECYRIGFRAREQIGRSIAIGFGSLIAFQAIVNIGVVTMLLPNTGLTLPFISAGLSSLVVLYMGVGVLLNISMRMRITF